MKETIGRLFLLLTLLATALVAQTWRGDQTVAIQVNDAKGRPVPEARVIFTFQGVPGETGPGIVATSGKGAAVLVDLAPGPWQVEVSHPDYLSYIAMVDVRRSKKPLVSASFLEAGGRSLSPVKVKFSKGNPQQASPVIEARQPVEPAPPLTSVAQAPEPAAPQVVAAQPMAESPPPPVPAEPLPITTPPASQPTVPVESPAEAPDELIETPQIALEPVEISPEPVVEAETPSQPAPVPVEPEPATHEAVAEIEPPTPEVQQPEVVSPPVEEPEVAAVIPAAEPPQPEPEPIPAEVEAEPAAETVSVAEAPQLDEPAVAEAAAPVVVENEPIEQIAEDLPEPEVDLEEFVAAAIAAQPGPPAPQPEPEPAAEMPTPQDPVPVALSDEATPSSTENPLDEALETLTEPVATEVTPAEPEETEPQIPLTAAPAVASGATPPPPDPGPQITSHRDSSCQDCESAEWTLQVSAAVPAKESRSTGSCGSDVIESARAAMQGLGTSIQLELDGFIGPVANGTSREAIRRVEPDLAKPFSGSLAAFVGGNSPCQIVGLILPKAVRFSRIRLGAADQSKVGNCAPGQNCAIGDSAWLGSARVERGPSATVVWGLFENRSTELGRRAYLTAYYRPPNANWKPRLPSGD